jgi:arylsulfatase A-like enzyme/Flp pilus assembly protein TadD
MISDERISRRAYAPVLLLLAFLLSSLPAEPAEGSHATVKGEKLNVLLITIDTLRTDRLSCYDDRHVATPHMDSLAERGTLFLRAFAHTPTTLPSHTNILLGTTPLYHGVHENLNFFVREECTTLAEYLQSHGYATAAFVGAYPLDARFGLAQGFDVYDDEYDRVHFQNRSSLERRADEVIDRSLAWLNGRTSPWFLWIHCFDPHVPYDPPAPFKTQYPNRPYDGEVAYTDRALGKLVRHLQSEGLFENSLVILTGDHGEALGDHGELSHGIFAYNPSLWIPLIICLPQAQPLRNDVYVAHIDIFPTVCDALGVEKPKFLQGRSLLPAIKGKKLSRETIYFESLYPFYSRGWAPIRGYIEKEIKFIETPIPEVYDLENDFGETTNLARSHQLDTYRKRLHGLMDKQSSPESDKAQQTLDRASLERLRSLGYISGGQSTKKDFGQGDDAKILLPYHNRVIQGWDLYKKGRVSEATQILEQVLEERDNIDIAYYRLGTIYRENGRIEDCLKVLRAGVTHLPTNYDIFFNFIKNLLGVRRYSEVISMFRDAGYPQIEFDPEIWNNLGLAYARSNQYPQAVKAYEQALALDERYPELNHNLGDAYQALAVEKRDNRLLILAVERYQKAIELDATYPAPYFGLGKVYRILGRPDAAITVFAQAFEIEPQFDQALMFQGLAYMDKGDNSKALEIFLQYKKWFSQKLSAPAQKKLEALIAQCRKR